MAALFALIVVADLTSGSWAPLAVLAVAAGASLAVSRAFPATQSFVRNPNGFTRFSRTETCDYARHAAMSPGMGGILR
jgi:hypothetical protein